MKKALSLVLITLVALPFTQAQGNFHLANIGNFTLENGQVIQSCKVGYHTYGKLNKSKSNVILFPTYFGGKSSELVGSLGTDKWIDTTAYYVITVDALGNGISSSPSNSTAQAGTTFPEFTMHDIVASQHQLLTKKLKLTHVYAVIGVSMGGMQALQWMASYPKFMDKVVSVAGTPAQTINDLLLWNAQLMAINMSRTCNQDPQNVMRTITYIHTLHLYSPQYWLTHINPDDFKTSMADREKGLLTLNANDWAWQLKAMIGHDIYKKAGKKPQEIKELVKAKVMIVAATHDQMVNPQPSLDLARLLGTQPLELTGECGHLAPGCEAAKVNPAIQAFLKR
jgi:homoserine O-acetyltransferase